MTTEPAAGAPLQDFDSLALCTVSGSTVGTPDCDSLPYPPPPPAVNQNIRAIAHTHGSVINRHTDRYVPELDTPTLSALVCLEDLRLAAALTPSCKLLMYEALLLLVFALLPSCALRKQTAGKCHGENINRESARCNESKSFQAIERGWRGRNVLQPGSMPLLCNGML